jgi:hypothetical protein
MKTLIATTVAAQLLVSVGISYGDGSTIAMLTGKCTKVIALGVTANPRMCSNKIVNAEHSNGRNSFTFVLKAKDDSSAAITFSGIGASQVHKDKNHVMQPVDRVILNFDGSIDDLKAVGSCSFANPYLKKPAKVSCKAETSQGLFIGEFISNGVSPDTKEL